MPLTYRGLVEETPLDFIHTLWTGLVPERPRRRILRDRVVRSLPFTESVDREWCPVATGSASDVSGTTHTTWPCTLSATVAVGDVIVVGFSHNSSVAPSGDTFSDSLGNTYTVLAGAISDSTATQTLSWAYSIVTNPGTPTITGTLTAAASKTVIIAAAYRSSFRYALFDDNGLQTSDVQVTVAGANNIQGPSVTATFYDLIALIAIDMTANAPTFSDGALTNVDIATATNPASMAIASMVQAPQPPLWPTTKILDTWNRASSVSPPGPNWVTPGFPGETGAMSSTGSPDFSAALFSGSSALATWGGYQFGPDVELYVDAHVQPGVGNGVYLVLSIPTAQTTGYATWIDNTGTLHIYDETTVETQIYSVATGWTPANDDSYMLRYIKGDFLYYAKKVGDQQFTQLTAVQFHDTRYTGPWYIGCGGDFSGFRLRNFGGGTYAGKSYRSIPTITGSASGSRWAAATIAIRTVPQQYGYGPLGTAVVDTFDRADNGIGSFWTSPFSFGVAANITRGMYMNRVGSGDTASASTIGSGAAEAWTVIGATPVSTQAVEVGLVSNTTDGDGWIARYKGVNELHLIRYTATGYTEFDFVNVPITLQPGNRIGVSTDGYFNWTLWVDTGTGWTALAVQNDDHFYNGPWRIYMNTDPVAGMLDATGGGTLVMPVLTLTPSGTDVYGTGGTAYTDSATVTELLTPSSTGVFAGVDASTVTMALTPSETDVAAFVDAATVTNVLTPSGTDVAAFVDAATVTEVITPSGTDLHTISDANTVTETITVSSTDTAQFVDSTTVTNALTPSSTDQEAAVDANTVAVLISPSSVDVAVFLDAATTTVALSPSSTDIRTITDAGTVSEVLTPSSTDIAGFTDANTISLSISPSSSDIAAFVDSSTTVVAIAPSGSDSGAFVDSNTVTETITPSSTDTYGSGGTAYSDSATVTETLTPSSTDIHEISDANTAVVALVPSSVDIFSATDSNTAAVAISPSSSDIASFIDSATVVESLTPSSTDLHTIFDSATISMVISPSSADIAQFIDANTVTETLSVSSTDTFQGVDSASISVILGPSSTDVAATVDSTTASVLISPSSTDIHEIPDSATVVVAVTPSGIDSVQFVDTGSVRETLTPSSTDIYATGGDSATVPVTITPSESDILAGVDSNTAVVALIASSSDIAAYIDANTVTEVITPSSVDIRERFDAATVSLAMSPSVADISQFVDAATISLQLIPQSTDVAAFIDSGVVNMQIGVSATDGLQHVDANTVPLALTVTYVESYGYGDATTVVESLTPSSVDVYFKSYVDAATAPIILTPSVSEVGAVSDAATVYLYLTPQAITFAFSIQLVGVAYRHWISKANQHYGASIAYGRYKAIARDVKYAVLAAYRHTKAKVSHA